jgi:uncharacterized protein (DUF302 family)
MKPLNFKKEVTGDLDQIISRLTESLKQHGFGVLTRIDFHQKMKEKLNKDVPPTVILGACNPQLAYEAYQATTDITALVPCNAVVREVGKGRYSVELTSPASLMQLLDNPGLVKQAEAADTALQAVLADI